MADETEVIARWRLDSLSEYLDIAAGAPVVQAERLSILSGADHTLALATTELRVADLVAVLDDDTLFQVASTAVDDLYRAGVTLAMWSPDVAAYVRAVWATILGQVAKRGFRLQYVVDHAYPERLGRPLELFPDLFTAANMVYVCPHAIANQLPEAVEAEVTIEGLAPFLAEGRRLAAGEARATVDDRRHLAYLEIAAEPGCLDTVLALADAPHTIGVVRDQPPGGDTVPRISITRAPAS